MARQSALGLLDLTFQFAHGTHVGRNICARFLLVLFDEIVNDAVIEIFTTKVGVTSGSQHFEDTVVYGKERDIKGTSAEVIDDNLRFTTLLIKAVCDGGSGRLVDNTENLEASNSTSILGRLTLCIVEV